MQASPQSGNIEPGASAPERFVRHLDLLDWRSNGHGARWACAFGPEDGTEMLSLYAADLDAGAWRSFDAGSSEVVLYTLAGRGTVQIAGRHFPIKRGDGAHAREGERLRLTAGDGEGMKVLLAVCPFTETFEAEIEDAESPARSFDENYPDRVVSTSEARREKTGDRSFEVLVGPRTGSGAVTQFIGSIPLSRAPEHYHHYEEVICVLSGEGKIWLGDSSAPVRPGSLVFLPRKQPHCLECTVVGGLELLGMFYPAGSPAVNYETGPS